MKHKVRKTKREKAWRAVVVASHSSCNLLVYSEKFILSAGGYSYHVDSEPRYFLGVIFFIVCLNLYCFLLLFSIFASAVTQQIFISACINTIIIEEHYLYSL